MGHVDGQTQPLGRSSAKYIRGHLGMVRSKKLLLPSLRNGVMVINIEEGGSLSFYKVFRAQTNKAEEKVALKSSLLGNGSMHGGLPDAAAPQDPASSIFLRTEKSRRHIMEVDDTTKAKIDKVSVYVSSSEFREPPEMPYLHIPANVPWLFKSINKFKTEYFQIIVPPLPNGELDPRVKIMTLADKVKKMMHVTSIVDGKVVTFGTVLDLSLKEKRNGHHEDNDAGPQNPHHFEDNSGSSTILNDNSASGNLTLKATTKNTQIFTFRCPNTRDLAVYAQTAQILSRIWTDNKIRRTTTLFSSNMKRIRSAEGLEIALQTEMLHRSLNKEELASRYSRQGSLGAEEYRCLPLYAYPYSWLTETELLEKMIEESKVWCDLREETKQELGSLKMEVLQCTELPKMDAYSASDPMVYVVCGPAAFVTDVIPDKCNAFWLPLARRACILPITSAYAQVYVGCFDYDGEKEMDDYIGRVVLDIPQIQAGYTYDVTLPLREASRVYHRNKLGFIRLRFRLEWNEGGERAALLSYLPTFGDVKKRMKNEFSALTVKCPDTKSFYNIAHTVYGKDIPGKYNNGIKTAVSREFAMISKMMVHCIKKTARNICSWKHPLLSSYIFCAWMYFVVHNSVSLIPAFIMSLIVILLLRNYAKYHVKSSSSLLYGHKTMGDMIQLLLFKKFNPRTRPTGTKWIHNDRPILERMFLKVFGMSIKTKDPQHKWRVENHSEFPFSVGSSYPKITHLDAGADIAWGNSDDEIDEEFNSEDAERDGEETSAFKSLKYVEDATTQIKNSTIETVQSSGEFVKKNVARTIQSFVASKDATIAVAKLPDEVPPPPPNTTEFPARNSGCFKSTSRSLGSSSPPLRRPNRRPSIGKNSNSLKASVTKIMLANTVTTRQTSSQSILNTDDFPENVPDQNVKVRKTKSGKSIQDEIDEIHRKAQKATFHLFDDRVFLVEGDKSDGEKWLNLHDSMNPILRKLNPILGGAIKIFDIEVNSFRAVFNIFMWKDPALTFWATFFALGIMIILSFFPWRLFFGLAGIAALGPQNYFLFDCIVERLAAKKRQRAAQETAIGSPSRPKDSSATLSASPLLTRNNVQMKPDTKSREIIVPAIPFRYNRFYDWPPDPSTTTMVK